MSIQLFGDNSLGNTSLGSHSRAARMLRGRAARAIASGVIGLALAAAVAAPASADPPPTTPPPALSDWSSVTSTTGATPATSSSTGSHIASAATAATLEGERQTFERGGPLAWETDTFEWYWSGIAMSSSTAWQADGYIFPNTVTLLGVKRSYASSAEHLWHGAASIGAGVVTPWGTVDVYSVTTTDYFTLTPGHLSHSNS